MQPISSRTGPGKTNRSHRLRVWAAGLVCFLGAWLLWTGMSYAIYTRMYMIPSASMAPTIRPGDRVGVQINRSVSPKRGEVWVFRMPLASGKAPNEAIKRIIGLPGETIEVASGQVLIDGQPLVEPYLSTPTPYAMPVLTLGTERILRARGQPDRQPR